MSELSAIARLFTKARRLPNGEIEACCPLHEDRTPSMTMGIRDGALVVHCHAGCDQTALYNEVLRQARAAGIEPTRRNGKDRCASKSKGKIVATYDYCDARGEVVFQVARLSPKGFRQRRPNGSGGWISGRGDTPSLPYRLPELFNANEIYVCEGEKDCDNLANLGLTATTNPGGADKNGEGGSKWPANSAATSMAAMQS